MPATSESQRRLFCAALSIKLGDSPASSNAQAAKLASQMSEAELREFCESKVEA